MAHTALSSTLVVCFSILAYRTITGFGDGVQGTEKLLSFSLLAPETVLLVVIYRLTLHPLAKYPGPWWAAITDWYTVYRLTVGDRHLDFYQLHKQHGQFVRFGPNRISVNSNTALKDIYSVQANVQKSQVYGSFRHFFGNVDMSMTTIDRKKHAFRRQVNVKALTPSAIKDLEEPILENIRYFFDHLIGGTRGEWGQGKDMSKLLAYLIADIMGDITFSRNWDVLREAKNRHFVEELPKGVAGIHLTGHMHGLLKYGLDRLLFGELLEGSRQLNALSQSVSDWRVAQGDSLSRKDFFAALLAARDPQSGRGFDHEELVSEAGLLITAGRDTTITATAATIFYILHNPMALRSVQEEVRGRFSDLEDIRIGERLSSCSYLAACIDEAMRLSPSVPSLLPRQILKGGLVVDQEWFPEGVDVGVPHYTLHHNEAYFPQPFAFKPERWLPNESESGKTDTDLFRTSLPLSQSAFTPFGVGRTSCIGKYLALQEMSLILARMIWLYDMSIEPGISLGEGGAALGPGRTRQDEFQIQDRFICTQEGPLVQFKRRT